MASWGWVSRLGQGWSCGCCRGRWGGVPWRKGRKPQPEPSTSPCVHRVLTFSLARKRMSKHVVGSPTVGGSTPRLNRTLPSYHFSTLRRKKAPFSFRLICRSVVPHVGPNVCYQHVGVFAHHDFEPFLCVHGMLPVSLFVAARTKGDKKTRPCFHLVVSCRALRLSSAASIVSLTLSSASPRAGSRNPCDGNRHSSRLTATNFRGRANDSRTSTSSTAP